MGFLYLLYALATRFLYGNPAGWTSLAAIVLFGVPAVLVCYISLAEGGLALTRGRLQAGLRPWLWLLPGLALFFGAPVVTEPSAQ